MGGTRGRREVFVLDHRLCKQRSGDEKDQAQQYRRQPCRSFRYWREMLVTRWYEKSVPQHGRNQPRFVFGRGTRSTAIAARIEIESGLTACP